MNTYTHTHIYICVYIYMRGGSKTPELSFGGWAPCSTGFPHQMCVLGTHLHQYTIWRCCERLHLVGSWHIHIHTHTYIYTYIYTHVHTYIHTYYAGTISANGTIQGNLATYFHWVHIFSVLKEMCNREDFLLFFFSNWFTHLDKFCLYMSL